MIESGGLSEGIMDRPAGEITKLLHAWSAGDRTVEDRLFRLVLPDLRNLAQCLMRRERREHTLEAGALLNEAYVRLLAGRERDWESRRHFYAVAARIMRRLLIDHARSRTKAEVLPLDSTRELGQSPSAQLDVAIAVDRLLEELQQVHPSWCQIVEFKYFVGLTDEETAAALGIPLRTVQRQYSDARRWLYEKLHPSTCEMKANATNA